MEIQKNKTSNRLLSISFIISSVLIAGALIYSAGLKSTDVLKKEIKNGGTVASDFEEKIIPSNGVELPVKWGDLGKQMIEAGVIDASKFESIYSQRGGLTKEQKDFFTPKITAILSLILLTQDLF